MRYVLLGLLFAPFYCLGQVDSSHGMPMIDNVVVYTDVVKVDSVNSSDLYQRAKRFFVDNYNSARDVIQLDDEKNGEIVGKGSIPVSWNRGIMVPGVDTHLSHSITVYVKDGRYKYEIKDLIVNYYESGTSIGTYYRPGSSESIPIEKFALSKMKINKKYVQSADREIRLLIASLNQSMLKKTEAKKSDW